MRSLTFLTTTTRHVNTQARTYACTDARTHALPQMCDELEECRQQIAADAKRIAQVACMHACVHACVCMCVHACMRACVRPCVCAHARRCMDACADAFVDLWMGP